MKNRFWAVIIKEWETHNKKDKKIMKNTSGLCFTWDSKHPEDKRKKSTVKVWAIYPNKKDAMSDARFRGNSYVQEVYIIY